MPKRIWADIGSIVFCQFPTQDGGSLPHFALVVGIWKDVHRTTLRLAYGSSKKVCIDGHLEHEFVIHKADELARGGLYVPTRFDLKCQANLHPRRCVVVGHIDLTPQTLDRLRRAALAAGLV